MVTESIFNPNQIILALESSSTLFRNNGITIFITVFRYQFSTNIILFINLFSKKPLFYAFLRIFEHWFKKNFFHGDTI